ncbi:hypothetical protein ONZ45_g11312 [Pleurotus djamor]|nr:hypothetical protein ONZ45_g11312 [Pleurotus djamor]
MNSTLRSMSRCATTVSRSIRPAPVRAFHSPFAVLGSSSPLTSPPLPSANASSIYTKDGDEASYDAFINSKTYVVCQPDPSNTFHEVPSGAYPTSAPYVTWSSAEASEHTNGAALGSTNSNPFAQSSTRSARRNASGVGESAAVRNATSPGIMGTRSGRLVV